MPTPVRELIQALRLLLEEDGSILASPEDAGYFRAFYHAPSSMKALEEQSNDSSSNKAVSQEGSRQRSPQAMKKSTVLAKKETETTPPSAPPSPPSSKPTILEHKEPDPPLSSVSTLSSVKAILSRIAPEMAILDTIPDDAIARKIATRWKTKNQTAPISVLSGDEPAPHRLFLEEVAAALNVYFGSARLIQAEAIEKENQWEAFLSAEGLKLIIICDAALWQLHRLRPLYKENPASGERTLGKTPLFLLPDLSLYLKDPLLKRSLWRALCQRCS